MIPKIFHLCWLSGDPYPKKIGFCIKSWKKYNPDYEVMLWDTNRFDVNSTPWTRQAFQAKKYAFVADYIRLYAVYNYGGIYLDSDVEVIKSFDDVLDLPYFVGSETKETSLELAAFGAEKGMPWVKTAMEWYEGRDFMNPDGSMETEVQPLIMSRVLGAKYEWLPIKGKEEVLRDDDKLFIFPMRMVQRPSLRRERTLQVCDHPRHSQHPSLCWTMEACGIRRRPPSQVVL